jgi:hypothetical protein
MRCERDTGCPGGTRVIFRVEPSSRGLCPRAYRSNECCQHQDHDTRPAERRASFPRLLSVSGLFILLSRFLGNVRLSGVSSVGSIGEDCQKCF